MGNKLKQALQASTLAQMLGLQWHGNDIEINQIAPLSSLMTGSLCFSKSEILLEPKIKSVFIAPPSSNPGSGAVIEASNPRLTFAIALQKISAEPGFSDPEFPTKIADSTIICPSAVIGRGVTIGPRTFIGHNVVIADGVTIGADCHIKSNTVIGEAGFGFERDEQGIPVRLLHLGTVEIGDRVEIGSFNTVCRATLGTTIIENDVKTDDHVHIAHNCHIRRGSLLTACVELSGGVDIGEFCWVGPNTSVMQKVSLGSQSFIGIGSNVTKSFPGNVVVAGNPARILRNM